MNEITKLLQNIDECEIIEKKVGDEIIKEGCGQSIPIKVTLKNYKFYVADNKQSKTLRPLERQ